MNDKIKRNDPCPCGSGKKYKACCLKKEIQKKQKRFSAQKLAPAASPMANIFAQMHKEVETVKEQAMEAKKQALAEQEKEEKLAEETPSAESSE